MKKSYEISEIDPVRALISTLLPISVYLRSRGLADSGTLRWGVERAEKSHPSDGGISNHVTLSTNMGRVIQLNGMGTLYSSN
jgi:hypothetical protein